MPDLILPTADIKARAVRAWYLACRDRYPSALVPDWRSGTAEDGAPRLTVQVVGEHAPVALRHFAGEYPLVCNHPGDQTPTFDYRDGRVVCTLRLGGVWVELWHHDLPTPVTPTPAVMPKALSAGCPSGRLPFPRLRRHTLKEN